jgi:hypothetical protein
MYKRELLTVSLFAAVTFLLVAGAGWFAVDRLHQTSKMLVIDTLPGLVDAGLAEERLHENRHVMHEMLAPHSAAERAQMIRLVTTNSVEDLWLNYAGSVYAPEDRENYQAMLLVRSNYLQTLPPFFDLVTAGKLAEAATLFYGDQSRSFQSYDAAAKKIFDYNVQQGFHRGKSILNSLQYAPWLIGGLCVLVFLLGLALGLRSGLGGGLPSIRRPPE